MSINYLQRTFTTVLFLFNIIIAQCQYRMPLYTDYLTDNYYVLHPAMAGAQFEGLKLRSSIRTQWIGVQNAPSLQSLNAHARMSDRSGIGALFFHDKNGFQSKLGFQATYAHHINFFRSIRADVNQLSFGLTAGGSFHRHNLFGFDRSSNDQLLNNRIVGRGKAVGYFVDVGISYNFLTLYTHLTIQNILFKGENISDQVILNRPKRFLASIGNFFELNPKWSLEPSVLLDFVEYIDRPNVDINLKTHNTFRESHLWAGFSYRKGLTETLTSNATSSYSKTFSQLSLISGFKTKKWMFSYTYTFGIGDININNSGFHQFTIGLDIVSDKYRIHTIRGIL